MGLRVTEAKGLLGWIDQRLPIIDAYNKHLAQYWTPKNFNVFYFFGSLALLVLVNQILTGIWLTMSYEPSAEGAFASVEYIMRDVEMGWVIRYMHSTGASAFFIVVYLHMLRGIMYGSYQKPRELIWIFGDDDLFGFDGRGLYGLFVTLGSDVILGRAGHCFLILSHSSDRGGSGTMGSR